MLVADALDCHSLVIGSWAVTGSGSGNDGTL